MPKANKITTLKNAVSPISKKALLIGGAVAGFIIVAGVAIFVTVSSSAEDETVSE